MIKKISMFAALLVFAGVASTSLAEECIGVNVETEKCRYFFKGYLIGLKEATENNKATQSAAPDASESYSERAVRTRLGASGKRNIKRTYEYCLPENKNVGEIAKALQAEFHQHPARWAEEQDPIGAVLESKYPCK